MKKIIIILMALMFSSAVSAESIRVLVTESIPIYETTTSTYNDVVTNCGGTDTNTIGLDTVIGTVLGVAVGNQFHNHTDAAKVIGGLSGGYIANNMRGNRGRNCTYTTRSRSHRELIGYDNCGYFQGQRICKEKPYKTKYIEVFW